MSYLILILIIWALLERKARFRVLKNHYSRCRVWRDNHMNVWKENSQLSQKIEEFQGLEALIKLAKSDINEVSK